MTEYLSMLEVAQAHAEGKKIEFLIIKQPLSGWKEWGGTHWNNDYQYRLAKPEPKYREYFEVEVSSCFDGRWIEWGDARHIKALIGLGYTVTRTGEVKRIEVKE